MAGSSTEYIKHHLTNLTYGKLPAGYERVEADGSTHVLEKDTWTLAHTGEEAGAMGFNAVHVDSLGWSVGLMLLLMVIFRTAAKKSHYRYSFWFPELCGNHYRVHR